jgi:hypothetical protein
VNIHSLPLCCWFSVEFQAKWWLVGMSTLEVGSVSRCHQYSQSIYNRFSSSKSCPTCLKCKVPFEFLVTRSKDLRFSCCGDAFEFFVSGSSFDFFSVVFGILAGFQISSCKLWLSVSWIWVRSSRFETQRSSISPTTCFFPFDSGKVGACFSDFPMS